ncbi:MAG: NUDIX hydrolase [bacterium]|nr:NUDIX hydrolase [bacterium]
MSLKLHVKNDIIVYDGKYIQTIERHFRNRKTGYRGTWEMVKRKTYGRIVAVIALTPKKEVILIKIFRIPFKCRIIEACAGLMDKKGESEPDMARRELLEETGYEVSRLRKLVSGPFNTSMLEDEIVYYLGTGARKIQEPELEDAEDIEVLKIPLKKLRTFLLHPPRGVKADVKLFGILHLLKSKVPIR